MKKSKKILLSTGLILITIVSILCLSHSVQSKVSKVIFRNKNITSNSIPKYTPGLKTIKNFLSAAMQPVGSTCYIWGGGWDQEDANASNTAKHIGVCSQWKKFFKKQGKNYDFCKYAVSQDGEAIGVLQKYTPFGLDCSGFVGWSLYNTMHKKSGEGKGYVFGGQNRIDHFLQNKWGKSIQPEDIKDYKAGDIMVFPGHHVYICIGECNDGSVVFVHAVAPAIQICGTVSCTGSKKSEAAALAKDYMKQYYHDYYKKFPNASYLRTEDNLLDYIQLRWDVEGCMKDPDNYTIMTPEEVLKDLFGEKISVEEEVSIGD